MMNTIMYCFLIFTLYIMTWVSAVALPFAPFDHHTAHKQGKPQVLKSPKVALVPRKGGGVEKMRQMKWDKEERMEYKGMSRIGSRPPNCEHKCGHCRPCIAIQVPTTSDHLGLQYANYEPEGWKCKCGSTFFNP